MILRVLIERKIEFWREKAKEEEPRFGRRRWCSAAEHEMVSDGLLASESWVGQKPGSAAEPQVRPPNMGDFRVLVWPPNVAQPVAYKRPQTENGRVFSPFSCPGKFMSSLGRFHVFLHLLWFLWVSFLVLKSFKLGSRIWSLETPELVSSTSPRFGSHQPSISKRLV